MEDRKITTHANPLEGEADLTVDRLFSQLFEELRREAHRLMANERPGITLQATELIGFAYERLRSRSATSWKDRKHFFRTAAIVMRHVLTDQARRRRASKRGGDPTRVTLITLPDNTQVPIDEIVAVYDALDELARSSARGARLAAVLELASFSGATTTEIGEFLGISVTQVKRDFKYARAWLRKRLGV